MPLNFRLAQPEVDYLIKHCRPRLFVFSRRFEKTVGALKLGEYRPPLLQLWGATGRPKEFDEDGYFYLVDRAKDMYISGGENVYPAEIERVLTEHPDIADAAVIGLPDETYGEVGHAYIIAESEAMLPEEDVLRYCRERSAGYKLPGKVTFRREIRNPSRQGSQVSLHQNCTGD